MKRKRTITQREADEIMLISKLSGEPIYVRTRDNVVYAYQHLRDYWSVIRRFNGLPGYVWDEVSTVSDCNIVKWLQTETILSREDCE